MKGFIVFCISISTLWIIWYSVLDPLSRAWILNYLKQIWWIPVAVFSASFFVLFILSLFEIKLF